MNNLRNDRVGRRDRSVGKVSTVEKSDKTHTACISVNGNSYRVCHARQFVFLLSDMAPWVKCGWRGPAGVIVKFV